MSEATVLLRKRTPPQKRISQSTARFNVACWGRQSGKTTFGLDKITERPITGRAGGMYWYILQTFTAAETAFRRYWDMHRESGLLKCKPHETDLKITLINDAKIFFKSGNNFEDLRMETLDGAIIDEVRQQDPALWTRVVRPMLSRRKGWCDFYSTPNGFDHFYDLAEEAKADKSGEWAFFQAPSTEAWWWTPDEIESTRKTMSEAEFAQEIMAEFRDLTAGKAYLSFSDDNLVATNPFRLDGGWEAHPSIPIVVAMDFNLTPMAWTLGQARNDESYWFDEIFLKGSHTQEATTELIARVRNHKPGVILIGDATGKAGQRAAAGQSDYDIIKNALTETGIRWLDRTPDSNPPVKDRVNTVNAGLKDATGRHRIFINVTRCPHLIKDLQRVVWKPGAQAILDQHTNPELTHASDGFGYAIHVLSPIASPNAGVGIRLIRRA